MLQQDKLGQDPEHWHRSMSRIGLDPPGWCDVVRSSGGCSSERGTRPESLAREAIPLRTRAGCAARENPLGLSSPTKRLAFIAGLAKIQREWPRSPLRCDRPVSKACGGSDGATQESTAGNRRDTHNSAADLITSSAECGWLLLCPSLPSAALDGSAGLVRYRSQLRSCNLSVAPGTPESLAQEAIVAGKVVVRQGESLGLSSRLDRL